jgi:toxin FitB
MKATKILLDTNVLSELMRPMPDSEVSRFVSGIEKPFVSAAVFHELSYGVHLLPDGARRSRMLQQIEAFRQNFEECTVSVDAEVASLSGRLRAEVRQRGHEITPMDALIGACAMRISARLATRNVKDFVTLGLEMVNPWTP